MPLHVEHCSSLSAQLDIVDSLAVLTSVCLRIIALVHLLCAIANEDIMVSQ
jgi:hypothetical protein